MMKSTDAGAEPAAAELWRADFDPATLPDWPEHVDELAARARDWESQAV